MASWAEDMERSDAYDEQLREEPGFMPDERVEKLARDMAVLQRMSLEEARAMWARVLNGGR